MCVTHARLRKAAFLSHAGVLQPNLGQLGAAIRQRRRADITYLFAIKALELDEHSFAYFDQPLSYSDCAVLPSP